MSYFCRNVLNSHRSGRDGVIHKVGVAGVTCCGGDGVVHIVAHRAHLPLSLQCILKVVRLLCPHSEFSIYFYLKTLLDSNKLTNRFRKMFNIYVNSNKTRNNNIGLL